MSVVPGTIATPEDWLILKPVHCAQPFDAASPKTIEAAKSRDTCRFAGVTEHERAAPTTEILKVFLMLGDFQYKQGAGEVLVRRQQHTRNRRRCNAKYSGNCAVSAACTESLHKIEIIKEISYSIMIEITGTGLVREGTHKVQVVEEIENSIMIKISGTWEQVSMGGQICGTQSYGF